MQVNPKMASNKWKNEKSEIISTNALCSFIQSIIDIEKSNLGQLINSPTQLKDFTQNKEVVSRLGDNYKVSIVLKYIDTIRLWVTFRMGD